MSQIQDRMALFKTSAIVAAYEDCGLKVHPDPFGASVVDAISAALKARRPFSAIRLGDAELNLLSFGCYAGTPILDKAVAEMVVKRQPDSFRADRSMLIVVRDLLNAALAEADIVGVLGQWWPIRWTSKALVSQFLAEQKGVHGQLRARVQMPSLARAGALSGKQVASAHFYFGVIKHISRLVGDAERTLLICRRRTVSRKFVELHPGKEIRCIQVGRGKNDRRRDGATPFFLADLLEELPRDLRGCLCLIGAGPWAEIYCTWVNRHSPDELRFVRRQ